MAFEFKFPDVGEGVTEGTLLKWLVKEGDTVKVDQPIAEIETDKAVVQVPSPRAGTILKLPWKSGDTIKVGSVLAVIGEKGEKAESKPAAKQVTVEKHESVSVVGRMDSNAVEIPSVTQKASVAPVSGRVLVMPKVRKLAESLGVNLASVKGTGPNGMITEADVVKASQGKSAPIGISVPASVDFSKYGKVEEVPLTTIRKIIAEHMQQSVRIAPHAVAMEEADVTELAKFRESRKASAEKEGAKLTFLPFIVKAVALALKEHPFVNCSLDEQKQAMILKKYYNIGIAVDTESGLMVPVIKNADSKPVIDIAKEIPSLAEKARTRKISIDEMKGGTFTVTNYGSIAGTFGVPVINYPEVAILGLGRISDKPVIVKGKGLLGENKIEARKILPLSLSFDHRVIDGAEAARFLQTLMKKLEKPADL